MMSDVKPEVSDLATELGKLRWDSIALLLVKLGVDFATVQQIGDQPGGFNIKLMTGFSTWLSGDLQASWGKVIGALKAMNKMVLANNLEQKYCFSNGESWVLVCTLLLRKIVRTLTVQHNERHNCVCTRYPLCYS